MTDDAPHETAHCTFSFVAPGALLQRFKPSMRFEPEMLAAVAEARDRLIGDDRPSAVMVVIPEGIPLNPEATNVDHFINERSKRRILALALVAEDPTMRSVSKFYLQWFPQVFPAAVHEEEGDALRWLQEQLGAPA